MAAQEEELWLYADAASGKQKGPLPAATLRRLLRRGLLQPQQFVWTPRLGEWTALAAADTFAEYCAAWSRSWFFMGEGGGNGEEGAAKQQGPVTTKELLALFLDGEVDGMTLVWTADMIEWQPIGAMDGGDARVSVGNERATLVLIALVVHVRDGR